MKPTVKQLVSSAITRGVKATVIASVLGVSTRTIRRTKKQSRSSPSRGPPSGVQERRRVLLNLAKRVTRKGNFEFPTFGTARSLRGQLLSRGFPCSVRSVQRDLVALGGKCVVRRRVPTRQPDQLQARKAYAKKYSKFNSKHFVFSDEAWITSNECTGRTQWVFRNRNGSYTKKYPIERKTKWNVASLQVWASCGVGFKGPIIVFPSWKWEDGAKKGWRMTKEEYIRRCLSKIAPHLAQKKKLFIQDGARSHSNKHVIQYCIRKNITLVDFPPYCPDLNRQEVIWAVLKRRVGEKVPMDVEDLKKKILEAWNEIPQSEIDEICESYQDSLKKVARS